MSVSGRVEKIGAAPIGDFIGSFSGNIRDRFIFSDLDKLDPEGRYRVIVHQCLPRGKVVKVKSSGKVVPIRFHAGSMRARFGIENLDEKTLFQAVLSAKAKLLIACEKEKEGSDFTSLVKMLYEGPEKSPSNPSMQALKELQEYSSKMGKVVRLSAERFGLKKSVTIFKDFVAIDEDVISKKGLITVQMARCLDGQKVVRHISNPNRQLKKTVDLFQSTLHVMPTLATDRYINSKGVDIFVSFHPFFEKTLKGLMVAWGSLHYVTQTGIVQQILAGVEAIHKEGVHGNLCLDNFLIDQRKDGFYIVITGLESFTSHKDISENKGKQIRTQWSAPEVFNKKDPPLPDEKQDVWQLGTFFQALFQKKVHQIQFFSKWGQEEIDQYIGEQEFPPPVAEMIRGMLQIDPQKRWSLEQVINYFEEEIVGEFGSILKLFRKRSVVPSDLIALKEYAEKWKKTIRISAGYFQLQLSATATPDFSVVDVKKSCIAKNNGKIKLAYLPSGEQVVRRISKYCLRHLQILKLFQNTLHVLPTLGVARYTNKRGEDTLVSYHPLFDMNLDKFFSKNSGRLKYETQVDICRQILLGVQAIHEKGVHGDLHAPNILIKDGHVVICDLEMFCSHEQLHQVGAIQARWSAPEVRECQEKECIAMHEKQDVWSLGLIFYRLFRRDRNREMRFFESASQATINREIIARDFPLGVAEMICGMLQIDLAKRACMQGVIKHFKEKVLPTASYTKRNK